METVRGEWVAIKHHSGEKKEVSMKPENGGRKRKTRKRKKKTKGTVVVGGVKGESL